MNVLRRFAIIASVLVLPAALAQNPTSDTDAGMTAYPSIWTYVPGVFVPAVPNAPFTATTEVVTHMRMPDGTDHIRTTFSRIARTSSGRIYNERRLLVPSTYAGTPPLLSAYIYDPNSRLGISLTPHLHLAREYIVQHPPVNNSGHNGAKINPNPGPGKTEETIGTQNFQGMNLQGIRKTEVVPANVSGTGQPITVTDEFWFSAELDLDFIIKHNDPRTGEQLITVTHLVRTEPDPILMAVPSDYKVVDETFTYPAH